MTSEFDIPRIVREKLEAFELLRPEFEQCFHFVQDVHGQRRLATFSVTDVVYYLHARWICECKSLLLSVPQTIKEDEGRLCLQLLHDWQQGDNASVVDYLHNRLDMLPVTQITRQIHDAQQIQQDDGLAQRLIHGRQVMLNRGFNLMLALDALFALSEQDLLHAVDIACTQFGHRPEQIAQQLKQMNEPLYAYVPHQVLAQCNMVVMNKLGLHVEAQWADQPGHRSWRVQEPTVPSGPYAQQTIGSYQELTTPQHNNPKGDRFVDRPEQYGSEKV